jgi:hypothetical protein
MSMSNVTEHELCAVYPRKRLSALQVPRPRIQVLVQLPDLVLRETLRTLPRSPLTWRTLTRIV